MYIYIMKQKSLAYCKVVYYSSAISVAYYNTYRRPLPLRNLNYLSPNHPINIPHQQRPNIPA